jgi:hypothetical protein
MAAMSTKSLGATGQGEQDRTGPASTHVHHPGQLPAAAGGRPRDGQRRSGSGPIRDRDGKYPALFDTVLTDACITVVLSGVQIEVFYNTHRPHHGIANARPLAPLPERSPTRTGSPT